MIAKTFPYFQARFVHNLLKTYTILVATIYIALSVIMKIPIYGGVLKLTPY
jgi:preprotein translocase subunit SecG